MRRRWLALGAWMVAILFNSSVVGVPLPAPDLVNYLLSKLAHILEYLLLGWLAWRALVEPAGGLGLRGRVGLGLLLMAGAAFAALDELRQLFVPGRGSSPLDAVIDLGGFSLGLLIGALGSRAAAREAPPEAAERVGGEDGDEQVHREHLSVAVAVRQEDHHHQEVQPDEAVQQPRRQLASG